MSTLKERIAARKQQAQDKQIKDKAELIAKTLGEHKEEKWSERGVEHDVDIYTFVEGDLSIKFDHGSIVSNDGGGSAWHTLIVTFKDKTVFEGDGSEVKSYAPGSWEKLFEDLHTKAVPLAAAAERKAEREHKAAEKAAADAEDREYREKWGL